MRFDHELTRRELVELAKPHWIGALINMATTAVATERNAGVAAKNRGAQLAAASMDHQGQDYTPTADEAKDRQDSSAGLAEIPKGMGLADLVNKRQPVGDSTTPASTEADFHIEKAPDPAANQAAQQPAEQQKPATNYGQYANAASGVLGALMQRPQPAQAQIPQAGSTNYQPTAMSLQELLKRKYGY